MTWPAAAAGYAALLALLLVALAARVILHRRGQRVSLGSGGDPAFEMRIRAHGNLAEYAPTGLLLLALLEGDGLAGWAVHALGLMLLAGRLLHAWSFSTGGGLALRGAGMGLTLTMIVLAALLLLARALT